ncbi:MAG: Uma2 family endonuclease [Spirochaetales bacterium]|nr:Uma2 family endonuclease [Spirochaetales bacterium]
MSTHREPKNNYFTYSDYKKWPDEERWEIIDGEAYKMSPAPGRTHQKMVVEIARQFGNFLEDKPCEVYSGPFDIFLPAADEDEDQTSTIVQPDISIICDELKLSEKGCTGAPDIVIEVVSPYGKTRDQVKKLYTYEKKGVGEYWIVHSIDKLMWKYARTSDAPAADYGRPEIFDNSGRPKSSILPGFELDLMKVFGPEPEVVSQPSPAKYRTQRKTEILD